MPSLGSLSPQATIAVGVIVGLISTSIQSLGLTLQRQSHLKEDAKEYDERKSAYKRPRWLVGMTMFILSNVIGSTIQITTLPLPVLSTLQAAGLVFNTAFASLLLKESFTRYSAIGTVLTCAGAALIGTFGAVGEPAHNLNQLVALLGERAFVLWMAATLVVAVLTVIGAYILKRYSSHKHILRHWFENNKHERPRSASSADSQPRRKRAFTINLPRPMQLRLSRMRIVRGLMYALISGILSAHSLLMAKSAVELVVRTVVDRVNQFNRFESWLILLALVFFALSQLYYLHQGLRLCSTSVLYPFVFCIYNVVAIVDGLIYFKQGSRLTNLDAGLVALGTVVLLAGVLALSWRLDDTSADDSHRASVTPGSILAPDMGVIGDGEASPLLSQSRSSLRDERAPLLGKRRRAQTLDVRVPLPATGARDIWAELDDDEDTDFLASLPRDALIIPGKSRRRADSTTSSQAVSDTSGEPSSRPGTSRQPTGGIRRASAPHPTTKPLSRSNTDENIPSAMQAEAPTGLKIGKKRSRGTNVHWEEQLRASRFDATAGTARPEPTRQDENG